MTGRHGSWASRGARARVVLRGLFRITDQGVWVAPGVLGCGYPRTERALAALSKSGVRLLGVGAEGLVDPAAAAAAQTFLFPTL